MPYTTENMEVLLLADIQGVGKKSDLIVVSSGYALNHLLPARKAIVATPNVRKQYAEEIKKRAEQRDAERSLHASVASTLSGKVVHIAAKAAKNGKLYAGVNENMIAAALKDEYGISVPDTAIRMEGHIKEAGSHAVRFSLGVQSTTLAVEVKGIAEKATAKA